MTKKKIKKENVPITTTTTITVDAKNLLTFVDSVLCVNSEAIIHITQSGLLARLVDTANVFMIVTDCECETHFDENSPEEFVVNLSILKKILKFAKGCEVKISVTSTQIEVEYGRFKSKLTPLDKNSLQKESNPPQIELNHTINFPGKYLNEICTSGSCDSKIFVTIENKVAFVCVKDGDFSLKEVIGISEYEDQRAQYSNNYMREIAKIVRNSQIKFMFNSDYPCTVSSRINDVSIYYMLAPRIVAD